MFEQLKQRMRDVLDRASTPGDPRATVSLMREAVVEAKMAVREMREQLEATRRRLKIEREELDTVRRRGRLAAQIEDAQTMQVAADYERRHGERVSVLEGKLAAQEAELMLAEREVEEMTRELKARAAGISGGGAAAAEVGEGSPFPPDDPLDDDAGLRGDIDRAARETRAAEMLAELKRRMGK
jgi:hypothetical protein